MNELINVKNDEAEHVSKAIYDRYDKKEAVM